MKYAVIKCLFVGLLFASNSNHAVYAQTETKNGNAVFWAELQKLCGKAFAGTLVSAPENDVDFKGKELVMHVRFPDSGFRQDKAALLEIIRTI